MLFEYVAFFGFLLDTVGKILVSYMALRVHWRVHEEHTIDERVFSEMMMEKKYGILGILFIVVGSLMELLEKIPS